MKYFIVVNDSNRDIERELGRFGKISSGRNLTEDWGYLLERKDKLTEDEMREIGTKDYVEFIQEPC